MKVKRKVQKTLPQLIEWVEKNKVRNHVFISDIDRNEVEINIHGYIFCKYITLKDTFTVEVEEVVDEDTIFKELICLDVDGEYDNYDNVSVSDFVIGAIKAIYIPNDDLTMTLIWRDGKLVE